MVSFYKLDKIIQKFFFSGGCFKVLLEASKAKIMLKFEANKIILSDSRSRSTP